MFWQHFSTARYYGFPFIWTLKMAWKNRNGPNAKLRAARAAYEQLISK